MSDKKALAVWLAKGDWPSILGKDARDFEFTAEIKRLADSPLNDHTRLQVLIFHVARLAAAMESYLASGDERT